MTDCPTSQPKRAVLICAGTICVGLGLLGAVLPILPTTPFMLLAAACYARASKRLYQALVDSSTFGPTIRAFREDRSIPTSVKRRAFVIVPVVFAFSIWMVDITLVRVLLVALAAGLLTYLDRLPSRDC